MGLKPSLLDAVRAGVDRTIFDNGIAQFQLPEGQSAAGQSHAETCTLCPVRGQNQIELTVASPGHGDISDPAE